MRHHLASVLVVTAALATTVACGPTVSIQRAPDVRITAGQRWAFGPVDRDGFTAAEGARIPPDSAVAIFRDALEAELTARGFPRTSPESAQFLVHFHVAQQRVVDTLPTRDDPPGGVRTPGTWGVYGSPEELADRVVSWEEGMLIVDAVTLDRGIVAWRGLIAGEIPERATMRPAPAVREAVKRLLRQFP